MHIILKDKMSFSQLQLDIEARPEKQEVYVLMSRENQAGAFLMVLDAQDLEDVATFCQKILRERAHG